MSKRPFLTSCCAGIMLAFAQPASAELDLSRAYINRFPNGLTVMILEDHSFPVVSVQALYKSGSGDESSGKTGLAHFLEHLAFRASENFPNAGATEAIYDAGGEWHGYTWLNQTTYFATVPKDKLDLLLRIEADRMAKVTIDPTALAAEKGAVITEMHGYENDPASVLLDAVTATAFQVHNYRNNTIGLENDVQRLMLDDVQDFYRKHYVPANAVLAIVGDVDTGEVQRLVERHFYDIDPRGTPRRNWSPEPTQRGERRTLLHGPVDRQYFTFAFPAPAASNAEVPAFLVLQQLLGGGSGFNFNQNAWGTPAEPGSTLHGLTEDMATWFIPTAERYIFTIKGSLDPKSDPTALEREIGGRLNSVRGAAPSDERLAAAKTAVIRQLSADIETTEDAAHQLAYMAGIGGYDMLVHLPERVRSVTAEQVRQAAMSYLDPQLRTVGWYLPGTVTTPTGLGKTVPQYARPQLGSPATSVPLPPPKIRKLRSGLPAIIQVNSRAPTATVQLLLSAPVNGEQAPRDLPGLGQIVRTGNAADLPALIADAARAAQAGPLPQVIGSEDPETRIQQMIANETLPFTTRAPEPLAVIVTGDVTSDTAFAALEDALGQIRPAILTPPPPAPKPHQKVVAEIARPLAQGALGYVVAMPPPGTREGLAWRMLLYILTHDYSGRLGRSAIGDKGLAYHIYSSVRTDGTRGWATLWTGVDPAKADALEAELKEQLARLRSDPPSAAEVDAARQHLLGRDLTAAQSNEEIADKFARQFVETGGVRGHEDLATLLATITPADLAAITTPFARGTVVRVDVQPTKR